MRAIAKHKLRSTWGAQSMHKTPLQSAYIALWPGETNHCMSRTQLSTRTQARQAALISAIRLMQGRGQSTS